MTAIARIEKSRKSPQGGSARVVEEYYSLHTSQCSFLLYVAFLLIKDPNLESSKKKYALTIQKNRGKIFIYERIARINYGNYFLHKKKSFYNFNRIGKLH